MEGTLGSAAKKAEPLVTRAGVISTVGIVVAYFFAARLSLALLEPTDGVAVFWPAAGVSSGILIALGSSARWTVVVGVVAATIAANLLGDRNIWSSVFFAVANAGDAVIIAGLIHRFCGSPFELNELRKVLALFAATVAGASLSGTASGQYRSSATPIAVTGRSGAPAAVIGTIGGVSASGALEGTVSVDAFSCTNNGHSWMLIAR